MCHDSVTDCKEKCALSSDSAGWGRWLSSHCTAEDDLPQRMFVFLGKLCREDRGERRFVRRIALFREAGEVGLRAGDGVLPFRHAVLVEDCRRVEPKFAASRVDEVTDGFEEEIVRFA